MDGALTVVGPFLATAIVWGSYSVSNFGEYINATGSTYTLKALLTSGAIHLGTATTGAREVGGQYVDGIALTPANIDAWGGLE